MYEDTGIGWLSAIACPLWSVWIFYFCFCFHSIISYILQGEGRIQSKFYLSISTLS